MAQTIEVSVRERVARQINKAEYICGNGDYSVAFDFDQEWDGTHNKTARFAFGGEYIDVPFAGNSCTMPKIFNAKKLEIGVYAGDLRTTTPVFVNCKRSILDGFGLPADPHPDVYLQIMKMLEDSASKEDIANAVADYLEKNPIEAGATAEEAAQIQQNKTDIEQLTQDKLDASALPEAVNEALAQAQASGAFKGEQGEPGPAGPAGADGQPGKDGKTPIKGTDYFTEADKQEIAEAAAGLVEVPEATMKPLTFTGAVNATYDGSEAVSVEIPTGGGGSGGGSGGAEWRQIAKVTLSEDAGSIEITKDSNGNPFELSEFAYAIVGKSLGTSGNIGVMINGSLIYYRTSLSNTNTTAELKSGGQGAFSGGWVITYKEQFNAAYEAAAITSVTNTTVEKMKSFWYGCTNGAAGVGFQAGTTLELWGR